MAYISLTIGSCKERKSQSAEKEFSSKSQIAEVDSVNRGMFGGVYLDSSRYRQMGFSSYLQFYEFQNYVTDLKMGLVKSDRTFKGNGDAIAYAQQHPRSLNESGWTSDREANLKSHEYIVVLDLDETLLRHFAGKNAYEQYSPQGYEGLPKIVVDNQVSPTNIDSSVVFRKGYREFLQKLRKDPNCRGITVFTAKADLSANDLKNKWNVVFDGYFTRNFLELDVEGNLKEPSKDLRIFDQDLQNVVLVDDNPKRVYQRDNLIVPTQFKPDQNSGTEVGILDQIADEIIYAGSCARQKSVSFAAAIKPYTYNSRGVVQGWVSNTVCQ